MSKLIKITLFYLLLPTIKDLRNNVGLPYIFRFSKKLFFSHMVTYRPETKFNQMFNPLTETFTNINRN